MCSVVFLWGGEDLLALPLRQTASSEVYKLCYTLSLAGNVESQYNLGMMYELGIGVPKDEKKSFEWILKSAEGGYADAQHKVSEDYEKGYGTLKDPEKAHYWALQAVRQNHIASIMTMGRLHEEGVGTPIDLERALYMYHYASSLGSGQAKLRLGKAYHHGNKVPADKEMAEEFLRAAAEDGLPEAWFLLGEMFNGSDKSKQALRYYENAAELGHLESILWMASGNSRSIKQGFGWKLKAAELGHTDSMYEVGQSYEMGKGVPFQLDKALEWYSMGAERDHVGCQLKLGIFYQKGLGASQDIEKSARWFRRAVDLGSSRAMLLLAQTLERFPEFEVKHGRAGAMFDRAATMGEPEAIHHLGLSYLQPELNGIDFERAEGYFRASLDWPESCYRLSQMITDGLISGNSMDVSQLLERSAEVGHIPSIVKLSEKADDLETSISWIEKAAQRGDVDSQVALANFLVISGRHNAEKLALWWFEQAMRKQHPVAMFECGKRYVQVNDKLIAQKGRKLILESARIGNLEAMLFLGIHMIHGEIFERDEMAAREWLRKAGEEGQLEARQALAELNTKEK